MIISVSQLYPDYFANRVPEPSAFAIFKGLVPQPITDNQVAANLFSYNDGGILSYYALKNFVTLILNQNSTELKSQFQVSL